MAGAQLTDQLTGQLDAIRAGDRRALAAVISAAENDATLAACLDRKLAQVPQRARRVGFTGTPGSGKSTLVAALIKELLERGHKIGGLLVDPSSPLSGGAVLGDRARLGRVSDQRLYVRSLASRSGHGAVATVTATAIRLLELWGVDLVLVETVGAGQSDVDICSLVDLTVLISPPGLGDELQAMKAGIMEVADLFVVTKSDRPGAGAAAAALRDAGVGGRTHGHREIIQTSALTGEGIVQLADHLIEQMEVTAVPAVVHRETVTSSPPRAPTPAGLSVSDIFDLSGRVAIITGASAGLGRRFAEVLHAAGASVVLTGRRADRLQGAAAQLQRAVVAPADMSDPAGREAVVRAALETYGRIDVLVNNAGVSGAPVPSEAMPSQRWDDTLAVNITGLFEMARLVAAQMLKQRTGSIVNITSVFGLVANSPVNDCAYAASKGAVVNLTRALAVEWAMRGVRVNAIAPGWFPSEMTAGMVEDESSQRYIRRFCPMERMGRTEELDGALLFLASDASSYCTGQTLAIDGGWTAR